MAEREPEYVNGKLTSWGMFAQHRRDAKGRGIEFQLTFDEWLKIWTDSGKLAQRGPHKGQYCMARYGDKGPYAVHNVKIVLSEENHREANIGRFVGIPKSEQQKQKQSAKMKGRSHTVEHNKKIGDGVRGKLKGVPKSASHRAALSKARLGKKGHPMSAETKAVLIEANKRRWALWRLQHGR